MDGLVHQAPPLYVHFVTTYEAKTPCLFATLSLLPKSEEWRVAGGLMLVSFPEPQYGTCTAVPMVWE